MANSSTRKYVDELDSFDPAVFFAQLPQPYRMIVKVLDGIFDEAWAEVEKLHPEVALTVDGQPKKVPLTLANAASPKQVIACEGVRCSSWLMVEEHGLAFIGTAKGALHVYESRAWSADDEAVLKGSLSLGDDVEVTAMSKVLREGGSCVLAVATSKVEKPPDEEAEASSEEVVLVDFVSVVEYVDGTLRCVKTFSTRSRVSSLELSPDGQWLFCVGIDLSAALHAISGAKDVTEPIPEEEETARFFLGAPSSTADAEVVCAERDATIKGARAVFFANDTTLITSTTASNTLRKYSMLPEVTLLAEWEFSSAITAVAVDEQSAIVGLHSGAVLLWDLEMGTLLRVLKSRHLGPVTSVALHRRAYAVSASDGRMNFYSLSQDDPIAGLAANASRILVWDATPVCVGVDSEGRHAVYDMRRGALIGSLGSGCSSCEANTVLLAESDGFAVYPAGDVLAKLLMLPGSPMEVLANFARNKKVAPSSSISNQRSLCKLEESRSRKTSLLDSRNSLCKSSHMSNTSIQSGGTLHSLSGYAAELKGSTLQEHSFVPGDDGDEHIAPANADTQSIVNLLAHEALANRTNRELQLADIFRKLG